MGSPDAECRKFLFGAIKQNKLKEKDTCGVLKVRARGTMDSPNGSGGGGQKHLWSWVGERLGYLAIHVGNCNRINAAAFFFQKNINEQP